MFIHFKNVERFKIVNFVTTILLNLKMHFSKHMEFVQFKISLFNRKHCLKVISDYFFTQNIVEYRLYNTLLMYRHVVTWRADLKNRVIVGNTYQYYTVKRPYMCNFK